MQKLRPGDIVRVRHSRWRVTDVRAYDACQVITLAGASGVDTGVERRVVAPFDVVEPIERSTRVRTVRPRRWRRACRDLIAANAPPAGLRFAGHARMDLLPHQLEPALAVLRGFGSRVLLADDVGLGKTVQAGLVAAELRARGWADRILILTPAGVREQWAGEISRRLSIEAAIVDATDVRRRVAMLPVGVNPWTTTPLAIASVDYVKRPEVLPAVASCLWDIVIVDEAHGVAGDSDRYRAVSALASRAAYVLLLTATPHNGDRRSFASLCAIGARDGDPLLVFRRSRHDVRLGVNRRVHRLLVRPSAAEARMHALLARFSRAVRDEHGDSAELALSVLQKRALSSARSLERSVDRRITALATEAAMADTMTLQLMLPLDDGDGELNPADEPPAWSAGLSLADAARERLMLGALRDAAHAASVDETKIRALKRLLRRIGEPALIFTEYRDTLLHLRDRLACPVVVLHGGLRRDERASALAEFASGRCSILLATDAAGEGLNLHHACRLVVNLELPWNPMRLEQRIGRVDRIGQHRTVHALHLIARHTGEPRILERLKARIADARTEIDTPDPIGSEGLAGLKTCGPTVAGREREAIDLSRRSREAADADLSRRSREAADADLSRRSREAADADLSRRSREAAKAEAARLTTARALGGTPGAMCDIGGPWLVRARHRKTRARLRQHTLLVFRAAFEDASGRLVESTLVPVVARLPPSRLRRFGVTGSASRDNEAARYEALLQHADVENAIAAWREEAARIAGTFVSTRLARERSIAAAVPDAGEGMQPGLFDRRVEAMLAVDAAMRLDEDSERRHRIAHIERAATLSYQARVLLIMVP
jgi:superfamily II DNA or RNA helicase